MKTTFINRYASKRKTLQGITTLEGFSQLLFEVTYDLFRFILMNNVFKYDLTIFDQFLRNSGKEFTRTEAILRYLDDLTPPTLWAATTAVASWFWDQPLLGWFGTFVSLGWLYLGLKKLEFEKYKYDQAHAKK